MKLNVEGAQGEGQTLLGDWLAEPLLAFFAGGGEPLAERDGDGEADAGAGLFWAAGWGDTDRDDALLKGCGLGDGLRWWETFYVKTKANFWKPKNAI